MDKKTDYHHHNLKEVLVLKALELLDKKPYEKITVRELTDLLNVSRTAIYRHFSSKEALFHAVILKGFEQLLEVMQPIYEDKNRTIEEKFYDIGEAYIAFALSSPARYRLMLGDKLMLMREASCDANKNVPEGAFGLLVALVEEAQREKLFSKENAIQQANIIWVIIHGQASLLIDGHLVMKEQSKETYKLAFKMMLNGLK